MKKNSNKKQKRSSVTIIIVNYNGKKYLDPCLNSLLAMNYPVENLSITVVDNGSMDGSVEFLQNNFNAVKIIENSKNNYAQANNLGIKDTDSEYIGLVNNDVCVDKDWLGNLVEVIQANNKIGCVGGKVFFPDGRIQSVGHQEFPNYYWGDKGLGENDIGQYDSLKECSSLSGSAVLFRRKCLEDVEYFDEDFQMYLEDVDIFIRCKKKKWKIYYVPTAIVWHKFHGSIVPEKVDEYIRRNRLILIAKHFPEKIGEAFAGKEFSSKTEYPETIKGLYDIIPLAIAKMFNCHEAKLVQRIMPDIFKNLSLLLNYERDRAIQHLNTEKDQFKRLAEEKDSRIVSLESELNTVKRLAEEKDSRIVSLESELNTVKRLAEEKDSRIVSLESELNTVKRLAEEKDGRIDRLTLEVNRLEAGFQAIRESKTYRFINKPFWKILDCFKVIFGFRSQSNDKNIKKEKVKKKEQIETVRESKQTQEKILVIRPQEVTLDQIEESLKNINASFPHAAISLLANVSVIDYKQLDNIPLVNEKFYYSSCTKKLTKWELLKLMFILPRQNYSAIFVLKGRDVPGYGGYQRAQILAWFSGSCKRFIYDVANQKIIGGFKQKQRDITNAVKVKVFWLLIKHFARWITGQILFIGFLVFFLVFIAGSIQTKRIISKLRKNNS